ncbi:MAG: RepB family plasmid replication initiator protein [Aestuariivita sp.]|nr:RepB family plasmid replication initiator protein [Aestuariivita sp.]MCY4202173.1 RepB family plasmid replication initiator protein [Aestuariivita sp.]MCY4289609.1 RepB family plasmid replication initiator protein [Aestuariivita sp.]MCY4347444.1 RepB family plasmid replication initiator protein [Aestuariivita sp.]
MSKVNPPPAFRKITVPSQLKDLNGRELTPAMLAIVWELAAFIDEQKHYDNLEIDEKGAWVEVPTLRLRGPGSRPDNIWLRECLSRLSKIELSGEYRGIQWGAVLIAEWHLLPGSDIVRLLTPPKALTVLQVKDTFFQIKAQAAHRLSRPAQRLYAELASRQRMNETYWDYSLDELKALLGVTGKYPLRIDFWRWVIKPALKAVNDFCVVKVTMRKLKTGRRVTGVRLLWEWKSIDALQVTAEEGAKIHPYAEQPAVATAPPLLEETIEDRQQNEAKWWAELDSRERDAALDRSPDGTAKAEIITAAYDRAHSRDLRFCEIVWHTVQNTLAERLGANPYQSWIAQLQIETLVETTATLFAPSKFHGSHVSTNYGDAIRE